MAYVARTIKARLEAQSRVDSTTKSVIFVISTYGIGKERILSEVASQCSCKIYVTTKKMAVLKCLQLPDYNIFTNDPKDSAIHVKGMDFLGETFPFFKVSSHLFPGTSDRPQRTTGGPEKRQFYVCRHKTMSFKQACYEVFECVVESIVADAFAKSNNTK